MSEKEDKTTEEQEKSAAHSQPSQPLYRSVPITNPKPAQPMADEEQWRRRQDELLNRQVNAAEWLDVITGAATVVALLTLIFLWKTLIITSHAADAAKESADAGVAAVRPWLVPVGITPPPPSEIRPGAGVEIDFKNVGKVPAIDPWINEEFVFWDVKTGAPPPRFSECPQTIPFHYGAVAPEQTARFNPPAIRLSLTKEQTAALTAHDAGLLVHACVHYGTVLSEHEGVTEYCTIAYWLSKTLTGPCPENRTILK